jgi:hypothetical protein
MRRLAVAIGIMIGTGIAVPAAAQRSMHIGVAGGAVFPVGKLDSTYTSGESGLITLVYAPPDAPMGLRLDYQYDGLRGKTLGGAAVPDMHINSVTANLVIPFRIAYVKPYAIIGGGLYPLRLPGSTKREDDWGANGGLGVSFGLPYTNIGAFVEVRYHAITRPNTAAYHFIPVTLGILF